MKKMLIAITAGAVLAATLSMSVLAEETETEVWTEPLSIWDSDNVSDPLTASKDVTVTSNITTDVVDHAIAYDLKWGSMDFSFTGFSGTYWDPDTLTYQENTFVSLVDPNGTAGKVEVRNRSDIEVEYQATYNNTTGKEAYNGTIRLMSNPSSDAFSAEAVTAGTTVDALPTETFVFKFTDKEAAALENNSSTVTIGTITISAEKLKIQ